MNHSRDRVLLYTEEFERKHGYTPTNYQISNELYLPVDKVASIISVLAEEGVIRICRPLS